MFAMTIADKLADYAIDLDFFHLPEETVHEAKRRVIDSLACAVGAFDSPAVNAARLSVPVVKDGLKSGILGVDVATSPEHAAFVNGVMIRYLDFNDTYLSKEPSHPSDNISAALAVSEAVGKSGEDLITALCAAYEVQMRLCDAASLRAKGWDHVAYGSFSATVAASMLFGLSREECVHALGIAGVTAPALRQTRVGALSMWKGAAFANAAKGAVFAALLAKNGMTGPAPVFEGDRGFFRLVSGGFRLPDFAPEDNQPFKMHESYIKYYPAEYHAQSAINAAVELSGRIEFVESIESVVVKTVSAAVEIIGSGEEKWRPATRESADHSLPFLVATALLNGTVVTGSFTADRLKDTRVLSLMDKTKVVVDEGFDRLYPGAVPALVEVTLKSGETLSKEVSHPKGHPNNPLTDLEIEDKFRRLSSGYFTATEATHALERLWALEKIEDMGEVQALFRKRVLR